MVTKTSAFNSTGLNLPGGTPRRGLKARVIYKNAATSSGAGTAVFRITESDDNSTFTGIFQSSEASLVLATTAISGEAYIPFETSKPYVRLELASITGTGASVDYESALVPSRP